MRSRLLRGDVLTARAVQPQLPGAGEPVHVDRHLYPGRSATDQQRDAAIGRQRIRVRKKRPPEPGGLFNKAGQGDQAACLLAKERSSSSPSVARFWSTSAASAPVLAAIEATSRP